MLVAERLINALPLTCHAVVGRYDEHHCDANQHSFIGIDAFVRCQHSYENGQGSVYSCIL